MRLLRGLYRFWYAFLVGEDWKVAVCVMAVLVPAGALAATGGVPARWLVPAVGLALMLAFAVALRIDAREA